MNHKRCLPQMIGLTLVALLLAACGPLQPTTGTITGMVLDAGGKPLVNIYDQETSIVALFCSSDDTDIECLHEDFWDMDTDVLFDSICGAEDTAENCILHLGQGATSVKQMEATH